MKKLLSLFKTSTLKSLSESTRYPDFCEQASRDDNYFKTFRRNRVYNEILEHVTFEQGQAYLNEIKKTPELLVHLEEFKKNDLYGTPVLSYYHETGDISTTTLRYIKVLADLKQYFGSLDNFKICEIGVGYGGQCRIIKSYFNLLSYTLVDIEQALKLSKKYLSHYEPDSVLAYKTMDELTKTNYDLVISNYAFTELPKPIQDIYLHKVIYTSSRGYITYNQNKKLDSYTKPQLKEILHARILDEVPLTADGNCIIVWP